jgi:tetratricopeptide (TPR) repeat protein
MNRTSVLKICFSGWLALVLAFLSPLAAAAGPSSPKPSQATAASAEHRDPNYWFQKGALCATYGNNQAAVGYFGKAIALDPGHSGAHFSQGVSYGQLGNYTRALAAINRAIEMKPRNALYYYGRARVYLLSGEKENAMADFRKAADLGDEDARIYLKNTK